MVGGYGDGGQEPRPQYQGPMLSEELNDTSCPPNPPRNKFNVPGSVRTLKLAELAEYKNREEGEGGEREGE